MATITRLLTPAELVAGTPITVVPGVEGVSYIPTYLRIRKTDGPTFTLSGTPQVGVGHTGEGAYTGLVAAGVLDQASGAAWRNGPAISSGGYPDVAGEGLTVFASAGISGTGSEVVVTVVFEVAQAL